MFLIINTEMKQRKNTDNLKFMKKLQKNTSKDIKIKKNQKNIKRRRKGTEKIK